MPAPHGPPAAPHSVHVLGKSVSLDEAAEGVRATDHHGIVSSQLLQLRGQKVRLPDAHAGLDHGREENLVHRRLHCADQVHGGGDVLLPRVPVEVLQEDGAGDLVWSHAACTHLPDNVPDLPSLCLGTLGDHAVHQLVEGHVVGLQPTLAHLDDECPGLAEAAHVQVRFDERVVGDDVSHARLLRLLHPGLRRCQVAALHTGLQHGVVHHAVQLRPALFERAEDSLRALKVARGGEVLDEEEVLHHVRGRGVQDVLGQVLAAATQR
mmetsp:Transcript_77413/g.227012  ORF Transcript_77413/g.227012 Transcript_77413/m.227012 type:complete len:266 (-) Transcript_77413:1519-2316(-)